jgi:chromosome partitioning protein
MRLRWTNQTSTPEVEPPSAESRPVPAGQPDPGGTPTVVDLTDSAAAGHEVAGSEGEDSVQIVQDSAKADVIDRGAGDLEAPADLVAVRSRGPSWPRPARTRVIAVANQKGGCAKTTSTVNLAAALAQAGLNVLVLDLDPQGNASTALGLPHHVGVTGLYDVIVDRVPLGETVGACPDVPGLLASPATIDLAGADLELISKVDRERRLKQSLAEYLDTRAGDDRVDYVLIDCPPSLSLLTVNAFTAASEVLIPVQCEYYALEGLSQLLGHIELVREHLNPELVISSLLLTMYDSRTRLSAQVANEVRTHFTDRVAKTVIPRSVRISEAPSHGQTVLTYDPGCAGAACYRDAARELAGLKL